MKNHSNISAPPRIVVDATACTSGGKVYVDELLPRLIDGLPDIEWIVYGKVTPELAKVAAYDRVQFRNVHFPSPTDSLLAAGVAKLGWREFVLPCDVLLHRPCLLLSTANFVSPLFRTMRVPVVLAIHNLLPFHEPQWYTERSAVRRWRQHTLRRLTIQSARRAEEVIAFSGHAKDVLCLKGVNKSRVRIIHHGIRTAREKWRGEGADTVLLVSHYFSYKNIDVVLRAWPQVQGALGWPIKLLVQGVPYDVDYYERQVELVRRLRLEESVTLGRGVASNELARLYATCRCLVFPAVGENCPITLLEAMSVGTPIVAAEAAPLPEICGDAAVYYATFDERRCADAIVGLLATPGKNKKLSAAGLRLTNDHFTWDLCAQETLEAIQRAWTQ
jgi:glycosyltransferase involved in cell wall biosynthesis